MSPLRVRDAEKLVSTEPILVREEASIYETVERLIDTRHARCAYVVDRQGRLLGIVPLKVLVEHVFAISGIGKFFVTAVFDRDYSVIMAAILLYSVALVLSNLAVDVAYGYLDPRIHYE